MSIRRKLRLLLSPRGRHIVLAIPMLYLIAGSTRLLGFQATLRWLNALVVGDDEARTTPRLHYSHHVKVVEAAARRAMFHPNCLHRSILLWWLLRRDGLRSEIRLGVRKESERLEAHAWVERGDLVLNDDPSACESYTTLYPS